MLDFRVSNGAIDAERTDDPRSIVARSLPFQDIEFTVEPFGKTGLKAVNGLKMVIARNEGDPPVKRRVTVFRGEMDGVKTFVTERDGKLHVIMTRNEIKP